jgi:hypothetical protein
MRKPVSITNTEAEVASLISGPLERIRHLENCEECGDEFFLTISEDPSRSWNSFSFARLLMFAESLRIKRIENLALAMPVTFEVLADSIGIKDVASELWDEFPMSAAQFPDEMSLETAKDLVEYLTNKSLENPSDLRLPRWISDVARFELLRLELSFYSVESERQVASVLPSPDIYQCCVCIDSDVRIIQIGWDVPRLLRARYEGSLIDSEIFRHPSTVILQLLSDGIFRLYEVNEGLRTLFARCETPVRIGELVADEVIGIETIEKLMNKGLLKFVK